MSIWTHVAGIIRIDCLRITDGLDYEIGVKFFIDAPLETRIKSIIGEIPAGSEGPLDLSFWWDTNGTNAMAACTLSIFGDLQDFDKPQEIVDWFKGIVKKLEDLTPEERQVRPMLAVLPARQASIVAMCESDHVNHVWVKENNEA